MRYPLRHRILLSLDSNGNEAGDTVYLLARTGKYLEYPEHREEPSK